MELLYEKLSSLSSNAQKCLLIALYGSIQRITTFSYVVIAENCFGCDFEVLKNAFRVPGLRP